MNVLELLQEMDFGIEIHSKFNGGDVAVRTLTMQREVILYLIENKKITASDDEKVYYNFVRQYTPRDLYKVAEYYRRAKGNAPLNYQAYKQE